MPNTRRADLLHRHVDDVSLHLDALDLLDDMDLSKYNNNNNNNTNHNNISDNNNISLGFKFLTYIYIPVSYIRLIV
jgi:hypothetical protein